MIDSLSIFPAVEFMPAIYSFQKDEHKASSSDNAIITIISFKCIYCIGNTGNLTS